MNRLCSGAETSTAPAQCFKDALHGRAGGLDWSWSQALDLCEGASNAPAVISCFESNLASGSSREEAIAQCEGAGGSSGVTAVTEMRASARAPVIRPTRSGYGPSVGDMDVDDDGDGQSEIEGDCDDGDPSRYAGNVEICDVRGVDEDCDPRTFGGRDSDGDGFIDAACYNTDASAPFGENRGRDCDDTRTNVHPMAPEVCNGRDDNCDDATDEGVTIMAWLDRDRDGFGDSRAASDMICLIGDQLDGRALNNDDCDDSAAGVNPAAGNCG